MEASCYRVWVIPPPDGFRLPDATTVGPVHLQVADLDRSLVYYREVLGLIRVSRTETGAVLGAGDGRVLVQLTAKAGIRPAPRRGAFGLYHFAILLPDRAALGRFAAHLTQLNVPFASADHLVSEALYLTDPDGLGIEVYADRPRASWKHRGTGSTRELAMASEPLNVASVIAAGAHVPWGGMPGGATMGHLHLHVGTLAEAEAFYHAALGLDKVVWSYPGALFLSAGGYHHHLGVNTWSPGPAARDDEARLREWTLHVPAATDTAAIAARVSAAGFQADADGDTWVLTDPWGTRLRVVSG